MQPGKSTAQKLLISLILLLGACGPVLVVDTAVPPSPTSTVVLEQIPLATSTLSPPGTRPQATSSPTITPAPIPTPTPIIHIVESGETVIGIAVKYHVTADAILLANPGLRPELLQIDQQITIPPPSENASDLSAYLLPPAEQLPLTILGFGLYHTPVGGIFCLGEVQNGTDYPAEDVRVSVRLYSDEGDLLRAKETWAVSDIIMPGDTAPFGVLFTDPPAISLIPEVSLESGAKATHLEQRYAELRVEGHQGVMVDSLYRVTGKVENLGQYDAMDVSLVVTLYGEDQRVTGFRKTILPQRLLVGASTDFDISFSPGGLGVHHHTVTVTGRIDKTSD